MVNNLNIWSLVFYLRGNENVGNVLVLTEEGEMENNLEGLGVSSHDDELRNTTVEGLSG